MAVDKDYGPKAPPIPTNPDLLSNDQLIRTAGFTIHSRPSEDPAVSTWRLGGAVFPFHEALKVGRRAAGKKHKLAGGLERKK